jgi:hypothetical protein
VSTSGSEERKVDRGIKIIIMRLHRSKIHRSPAVFVIFLLALLVGVVSPFALGSVDAGTRVYPKAPSASSNLFQQPRSLVAQSAVAAKVSESSGPSKSRIRKFLSQLDPSSGRKDGSWKSGEAKATIPARLLFSYVAPLLDLASERTLTENDAFEVAENMKIKHSVESLADIYEKVRCKAQKRIEKQREKGSERLKNSQSILLLKALLSQQRKTLVLTGILRFVNTGIQAFPPILVSRLLRSIEAGNAFPVTKALSSALMLVSVLTLKMINENQFFHNVVNMSTHTRGSLEGLIFDKSLRLPDGGSGVLTKRGGNEKEKMALGSGGVLNLMQSDASTIESAAMQIHTIWDGPLQVSRFFWNREHSFS